ncbi:uncharacterized protein CMU_034260 [Cryptosporidium muris RN66]|uniref:Uncharacterized protein n=1 Tax=Cryptosporidium muris (strain RN66) TaxID=441375 RepID=B6AFP9_CRYMR|nr:uncharacterized protein CMU_034260 [Cryptosporidium muris RN66]EEA07040.1 hypothetical protein CMU_034260 [Cryptosporidium muris RN66]|eukprot:XP_002141389.1 hypothetical protein [Cryptosporidium muris RN66]
MKVSNILIIILCILPYLNCKLNIGTLEMNDTTSFWDNSLILKIYYNTRNQIITLSDKITRKINSNEIKQDYFEVKVVNSKGDEIMMNISQKVYSILFPEFIPRKNPNTFLNPKEDILFNSSNFTMGIFNKDFSKKCMLRNKTNRIIHSNNNSSNLDMGQIILINSVITNDLNN